MAVRTYDREFWQWYFGEHLSEYFPPLSPAQHILSHIENVFNDERTFDLFINLDDGVCYDEKDNKYTIPEYIAILEEEKVTRVERDIEIEYERWKGDLKAEMERMAFVRDPENYCWKKKTGKDSMVVVTKFDIILESVIERFNIKTQEWERYYEGELRYLKYGQLVHKEFRFEPAETHSKTEFSKAVWEKDMLEIKNMKDDDVRSLWWHLDVFWKPRVVREFNHSGFITFENKKYFMAENVLIKFPNQPGKKLELMAKNKGAFPLEENKYVKPPEDVIHLPRFDLGVEDHKTGQYLQKMNMLLNEDDFRREFRQVEDHFCSMVGGDSEFRQWGKLLLGYVFSFFFFDEIYDYFNHVIFLYLYGEGNVGKGEVAKRILDFFGINYLDSLNTPRARSVDVALEENSQIPKWVDEHVPEVPGVKVSIPDQMWNSWFELKQRQTSMQKGGSWATERKEVRTMPLFCSNFKPRTDHLLSRSLIVEYKKSTRGPEHHVQWLAQEKELLQLIALSFMQHYNLMDRRTFTWDLDRIRKKLKDEVKAELKKKTSQAILQDRQISQFTALLTVYHWIDADYRKEISRLSSQYQTVMEIKNRTNRETKQRSLDNKLQALLKTDLYQFVKNEIIRTAILAARHDPLTDYIESLGALVQAGKITQQHFNWTKAGSLKIWAKAIWDIYEHEKRGTDNMVRKDMVEEKLRELSELSDNGDLKVLNWTYDGINDPIRQRGFYIKNALKYEAFRVAFNYDKFRPTGAPQYYTNKKKNDTEGLKMDDLDDIEQLNLDDDIPF